MKTLLRRGPFLAGMALFSCMLMNCAGTVNRQVDIHDPAAYQSMVANLKTGNESRVLLRDGGEYSGKITAIGNDTIGLQTPHAYTKFPLTRISILSYKDHALGAVRGMYHGFLWVSGIVAGVGILAGAASEPDFFPIALGVGALYGALPGLLIGGIGGANVKYQLMDGAGRGVPEIKPIDASPIMPGNVETRQEDTARAEGTPLQAPPVDEYVTPAQLDRVRIVLKEGSPKKSCVIREINKTAIVYENDGTLHDLAIEKIQRVEFARDGVSRTAMFDKNGLRVVPMGRKMN